ncbi:MAG TPA: hypothetical protein VE665_00260 [Hyphomicrobiaceae bacterium]|nr:hypothetical protein [Hyphomicrobiaceae bacterium]
MTKQTGERHGKQARDADRRTRLAQALRANLQKRKAQARARAALGRRAAAGDEKGDGEKS